VLSAGYWAYARRGLFKLAEAGKAPLAVEAMRRIDAIFDAERAINGASPEHRRAVRQEHIAPMVTDLLDWMRESCKRMSPKAMNSILSHLDSFTRFLHDGRICLSNNAAKRALRGIALGRRAWMFAGSDRGGKRAADLYSLIVTAKTQRRRSPGLARGHPRAGRRPPERATLRTPAMALESRPP